MRSGHRARELKQRLEENRRVIPDARRYELRELEETAARAKAMWEFIIQLETEPVTGDHSNGVA